MIRTVFVSAIVLFAAESARAETLPLVGVPTGYTPGVAFTFDITAPGLTGLTDYTLAFTVTAGSPPNLPDLTVTIAPPASGSPFPDTSNFSPTIDTSPGVNSYFITLTDASSGSGVNTSAGVNDNLATVTITPGVNLSGPITIQFTQNDFSTSRDVGFDLPPTFTINQLPGGGPEAVPGPSAWLLLGLGGLCVAGRNRWLRTTRSI
jgi:hypothetical protein